MEIPHEASLYSEIFPPAISWWEFAGNFFWNTKNQTNIWERTGVDKLFKSKNCWQTLTNFLSLFSKYGMTFYPMVYISPSHPLLLQIYIFKVCTDIHVWHTHVRALTNTQIYNVSINNLQVSFIFCVPIFT